MPWNECQEEVCSLQDAVKLFVCMCVRVGVCTYVVCACVACNDAPTRITIYLCEVGVNHSTLPRASLLKF